MDKSFSSFDFGYAYYGLGYTRHASSAEGPQYGKRFKFGVLGVCLNMYKGTLSFALNGKYFGIAFKDNKLKKGPIYPAVSLLHEAGCKLKTGLKPPLYMK